MRKVEYWPGDLLLFLGDLVRLRRLRLLKADDKAELKSMAKSKVKGKGKANSEHKA